MKGAARYVWNMWLQGSFLAEAVRCVRQIAHESLYCSSSSWFTFGYRVLRSAFILRYRDHDEILLRSPYWWFHHS